jgi:hypothetical protein
MQRFEQLRAVEGTDVLSAVELARMAQGQRFAKLQAPPPVVGAGGSDCHVVEALPEPEPEPEPEPGSFLETIAVPVGPAIGFISPGVDCRDEACGYVGMSSGGPACKSDHLAAHACGQSGACSSLTCRVGAGFADVQTLESGELGASELQQFRLQFGAPVLEGKPGKVDVPVCTPATHCEDSSDAGSTRSSPGDAPDFPQPLRLGDDSDDSGGYGSEDDRRNRASDSSELVWRRSW